MAYNCDELLSKAIATMAGEECFYSMDCTETWRYNTGLEISGANWDRKEMTTWMPYDRVMVRLMKHSDNIHTLIQLGEQVFFAKPEFSLSAKCPEFAVFYGVFTIDNVPRAFVPREERDVERSTDACGSPSGGQKDGMGSEAADMEMDCTESEVKEKVEPPPKKTHFVVPRLLIYDFYSSKIPCEMETAAGRYATLQSDRVKRFLPLKGTWDDPVRIAWVGEYGSVHDVFKPEIRKTVHHDIEHVVMLTNVPGQLVMPLMVTIPSCNMKFRFKR